MEVLRPEKPQTFWEAKVCATRYYCLLPTAYCLLLTAYC